MLNVRIINSNIFTNYYMCNIDFATRAEVYTTIERPNLLYSISSISWICNGAFILWYHQIVTLVNGPKQMQKKCSPVNSDVYLWYKLVLCSQHSVVLQFEYMSFQSKKLIFGEKKIKNYFSNWNVIYKFAWSHWQKYKKYNICRSDKQMK